MKPGTTILAAAAILLLAACTHTNEATNYNSELCNELAVKIDGRKPLDQADYTAMIGQSESILRYLIDKSRAIGAQPDSTRAEAWRTLLADPEYLERFGYMFTLGSALYQAQTDGALDKENSRLYEHLDRYNAELASLSDSL